MNKTPDNENEVNTLKTGDRVTMTEEGLRQKLQGRKNRTMGTVLKVYGEHLKVKRDGEPNEYGTSWHSLFWRKL